MCVNWRGGAVSGHPLAVNPAYLTAEAGGGTVDEIPETQGIGLRTPPFGTGHTPRVMVEIDAVKTVVVHHVGVQPAIRTMVDVLEEHAVQSPACVMGGLPTLIRTMVSIVEEWSGKVNGRVRSPFMLRSIQVDCSPVYSRYPRNRNGKYGRLGARLCNPRWEYVSASTTCIRRCVRRSAPWPSIFGIISREAADLTVGQMADIAHVSQPTVIRFARKLGFGGYRELRYVLRNPAAEHKVTFNPLAGFDLNPWDGEDEIPR